MKKKILLLTFLIFLIGCSSKGSSENTEEIDQIISEDILGENGRFKTMASLITPNFPGGPKLRSPLLALAMTWYSMRDELGL